jgi:hypothetical protein
MRSAPWGSEPSLLSLRLTLVMVMMSMMDSPFAPIRSRDVRKVLGHCPIRRASLCSPTPRRRKTAPKPCEKGWRAVYFSFAGGFERLRWVARREARDHARIAGQTDNRRDGPAFAHPSLLVKARVFRNVYRVMRARRRRCAPIN